MPQYWWVFALSAGAFGVTAYAMAKMAWELKDTPPPIVAAAPEIDAEPERLLRTLADLQARLDLYKVGITEDGTVLDPAHPEAAKGNLISQRSALKSTSAMSDGADARGRARLRAPPA
jgi:hypothetical protein